MENTEKKTFDKREVARRLEEIADRSGGALTPEAVVEDARDPDSPLHDYFEWDVRLAAEKHWLDTARSIIRSVEVVVRTERVEVKAPVYVRDPDRPSGEAGYVAVKHIRSDYDAAEAVLKSDAQRVMEMYRRLIANTINLGLEETLDARLTVLSQEMRGLASALLERKRAESPQPRPKDPPGLHPL